MEYISPIERAATLAGGLASLARMLGVAPPTVHEWKTLKRPVPPALCVAIVRVTNGAITLQELRPNDWQDFWPELAHPTSPAAMAETAQGV